MFLCYIKPTNIPAQAVLFMDGEGNVLADKTSYNHPISTRGAVSLSTSSFKHGLSSIRMDNVGGSTLPSMMITSESAFDFRTGDFTAECWLHQDDVIHNYPHIMVFTTPAHKFGIVFGDAGYGMQLGVSTPGAGEVFVPSVTQYATAGKWTHFAIVRSAGIYTVYIDGVSRFTQSNNADITGPVTLWLGAKPTNGTWYGFNSGNYDDITVIKGIAKYTSNFVPE